MAGVERFELPTRTGFKVFGESAALPIGATPLRLPSKTRTKKAPVFRLEP